MQKMCYWRPVRDRQRHVLTKIFMVMRLTAILLTVTLLQVHAAGRAQAVTLKGKDLTMKEVFAAIKQQTGYVVFAKEADLLKTGTVSLSVTDMPLEELLRIVLKDQPVEYIIRDRSIILSEKPTLPGTYTQPAFTPVKGRISNADGRPLAGVSIFVRGTTKGTSTDVDGNFQLDVNEGDVIDISSVGFVPIRLQLSRGKFRVVTTVVAGAGSKEEPSLLLGDNAGNLVVQLAVNPSPLNELVVKGYYNTTKELSTGTIASVKAAEIARQPVSNPMLALQGRMAGVQVIQQSGVPGSNITIRIRGQNSIRYDGNDPFFIIDGVPYTSSTITSGGGGIIQGGSPMNNINPADIESIEVLKDADATAIYGSRGANGVILITTKRAKGGDVKVSANVSQGMARVAKFFDLLNTEQYLMMRKEGFANDGTEPSPDNYDLTLYDQHKYTDWQKELIGGTAKYTNAQLSVNGGSHTTRFLLSAGYGNQTAVFNDKYADRKLSTHFNLNHQSTDRRFNVNFTASYFTERNRLPLSDPAWDAVTLPPNAPDLYNPDGTLNWEGGLFYNPAQMQEMNYDGKVRNLMSGLLVTYSPLRFLTLKLTGGYNSVNGNDYTNTPIASQDPAWSPKGYASFGTSTGETWNVEPQIEFNLVNRRMNYSALVGGTIQSRASQVRSIGASGFTSDALLRNIMAAATRTVDEHNLLYKYNALFARVGLIYDQKYILNLTGRRDGSSRFAPNYQFADFGAVAIGWIFSKEHFFSGLSNVVSFAKLKGSYGTTGSDNIPDYGFLESFRASSLAYQSVVAFVPSRLRNDAYRWELNKKLEAGIELGFLQDRLYITATGYQNRSSNQLVGLPLSGVTGFTDLPYYNLPATVQNRGLETEISYETRGKGAISWRSSFNISFERNKLVSYPDIEGSDYWYSYEVGKSLFARKRLHVLGLDPQTGQYIIDDRNKDGYIGVPDWVSLNDLSPRYYGGWTNVIRYRQLELAITMQYAKQQGRNYFDIFGVPGVYGNKPTDVLNRWQKPGDKGWGKFTGSYGSETYSTYSQAVSGDLIITDASYIRVQNAELSYRLHPNTLQRFGLTELRIFAQGQNLLTFTNYIGFSPENQNAQRTPALRVFNFGFNITL